MAEADLTARVASSVGSLPAAQWDALAGPGNPFMSHAFLTALEDSGSVGPGSGWTPAPLAIEDGAGNLLAALPAYAKGHSQGEYVFDHAWADAWHRAGGQYYPKLQIAAPFTPATGPRLLLSDPAYAAPLLRAAEQLCRQQGWSSAHATFVEPAQLPLFEQAGWLARSDIQFHWLNRGYESFDDFLDRLSSRKRKAIRKERLAAQAGVEIRSFA
jgi:predicted N-acyltransferase